MYVGGYDQNERDRRNTAHSIKSNPLRAAIRCRPPHRPRADESGFRTINPSRAVRQVAGASKSGRCVLEVRGTFTEGFAKGTNAPQYDSPSRRFFSGNAFVGFSFNSAFVRDSVGVRPLRVPWSGIAPVPNDAEVMLYVGGWDGRERPRRETAHSTEGDSLRARVRCVPRR